MFPLIIHKKYAVEDLYRRMGIQGRADPGDRIQIAVDEFAKPLIVIHGPGSRAPADKEFESRDAKGILDIDQHKIYAELVL